MNPFPQLWRGLAANRTLKQVTLNKILVPNGPDTSCFLTELAVESFTIAGCLFEEDSYVSFCEGIESSPMKHLDIGWSTLAEEDDSWGTFWSSLEHGTTHLESLIVSSRFNSVAPAIERFLTNNTTIQKLCLSEFLDHRDNVAFAGALGRSLAVNTTVKCLELLASCQPRRGPSQEVRIHFLFTEGLSQNVSIESIRVDATTRIEATDALTGGLEQMMRNRAGAVGHDTSDDTYTNVVLKELEVVHPWFLGIDGDGVVVAFDGLLDRLAQNDAIPVEKLMSRLDALGMTMPQKVLDLVCSSRVIRSLQVLFPDWNPSDDTMSD